MYSFNTEQKVIKIDNICLGGKMGEYPTVLVGSIFHRGHYIVSDREKGIFDKKEALKLIQEEEELSLLSGNPRILDVVAETEESIIRYLDFIIENTTTPFFIDSPLANVRLAGIKYCAQQNVLERAIYNTIEPNSLEEEYQALAEIGVKNVIILAFSSHHMRPRSRMELLLGKNGENGLIERVKKAGIQNILIDPGVLDLPSNSWTAAIMHMIKDELGYPVGCAPSNALYTWLRNKKIASPQFEACGSSVMALPIFAGADFLLYGPIQNSSWVYPAVSVVDAMIGYGAKLNGAKPQTKEHPLFRVF